VIREDTARRSWTSFSAFGAIGATLLVLAPAALAGGVGQWTQVTGPAENIDEVGVARAPGGSLHVAWPNHAGANEAITHTKFSPGGKKLSQNTVVAGWASMNNSIELVQRPGGGPLVALWGGIRSTSPGETFFGELAASSSVNGGASWGAPTPYASGTFPGNFAYAGTGVGAAAGSGKLVAGTGDADNGYSFGPNSSWPAFSSGGCCIYHPEVAIDQGKVLGAWYSNRANQTGLFARTLGAAAPTGPVTYVPGSSEGNHASSVNGNDRTGLIARQGGGLYLGYLQGYPTAKRILLWRFGGGAPKTVATANQGADHADLAGIANGPGGRLWVFWYQDHGSFFASRTNPAATKVGGIVEIPPPRGGDFAFGLWGEGSNGPLDLLANIVKTSGADAVWQTQALPGLLVTVQGAQVVGNQSRLTSQSVGGGGHPQAVNPSVVFTVTDAGDPLASASVNVAGVGTKATNASGKASFQLGKGTHKVQVHKGGYAPATLTVKVG
jgi:hypothetical protein